MYRMPATDMPWNPHSDQGREKHSSSWVTVNKRVEGLWNSQAIFVLCSLFNSVLSASYSKVNQLSGYKSKIPVNKLTFGKQSCACDKSQTVLSCTVRQLNSRDQYWIQHTELDFNPLCHVVTQIKTHTSPQPALGFRCNTNTPSSGDKNTSSFTLTCGQREMCDLTSCTYLWEHIW